MMGAQVLGFLVLRGGDDQHMVEMLFVMGKGVCKKVGIVDTHRNTFDVHRERIYMPARMFMISL
jgi:hypothetical protein